MNPDLSLEEQLSELFGSYKAEWLREKIFELYTEPTYFPELTTDRPCVLVGGRGTGKTTVLRSLSYEGRFAIHGRDNSSIPSWNYYGFYYRVNTNRVTAFKGPDLSSEKWLQLFSHYMNLLFCSQVFAFLKWYSTLTGASVTMESAAYERVCTSLCIASAIGNNEILMAIQDAVLGLEAFINNAALDSYPRTSLPGAPVEQLMSELAATPAFSNKRFFFLIDEYENFLDDQQIAVNTLIKHSGPLHSFKIGVRELGWRKRGTLNPSEHLVSPSDYVRINIADKLGVDQFRDFASHVCNARIKRLSSEGASDLTIEKLLPELSMEEEAQILGLDSEIRSIEKKLSIGSADPLYGVLRQRRPLELYFASYWAGKKKLNFLDVIQEWRDEPNRWRERYDNYKYSLLFVLRRGKSGIRKYYAGWDTYVHLASGNIRYLLELVDQSLLLHLREGKSLAQPIAFDLQTKAAQGVGKKNLSELEGLSVRGAQMTKLLLSLGRIFEQLAAHPEAHAPEITQFHLADELSPDQEVEELIAAAVMHLALIRTTANKLESEDIRSYDYAIHPIFAPFFNFSYRKKRKLRLRSENISKLVKTPKTEIEAILKSRRVTDDSALADQLALFQGYYGRAN